MKARVNSFQTVADWCTSDAFIAQHGEKTITTTTEKTEPNGTSEADADGHVAEANADHKDKRAPGIVLGGRSMGSRAAILTATKLLESPIPDSKLSLSKRLILVSYPLVAAKGDVRDQILLDLPSDFAILFVIGSRDSMCPLDQLAKVRKAMKAKSWLVRVEDANHGMEVRPKKLTEKVVQETGHVAGMWLDGTEVDEERTEGRIWIEEEDAVDAKDVVKWSGWVKELEGVAQSENQPGQEDEVKPTRKRSAKSTYKEGKDGFKVTKQSGGRASKDTTTAAAVNKRAAKSKPDVSAANKPETPASKKRKRSSNVTQDETMTPSKKRHANATEAVTPTTSSASIDPSSVAARTRSRKKLV